MSHPSHPPPYDAVYVHGSQVHPVQVQPQQQVFIQVPHNQHVIHRPVVITGPMDVDSCIVVCPSCNYNVATKTEMRPACRTHMWAAFCFFCGLWPCCIIPYCMPSCNNIDHYCPKCNAYIGSYTG